MELGENIMDSIKYPFTNLKNCIILALLSIFSFLIIPIPFYVGYLYKIMDETLQGNDELPEFGDLGDLCVNGLKLIGVYLVYIIILVIIYFILVGIGAAIGSSTLTTILACIAGLICFILGLIVIPAPINMILNDGSFGAAFDFGALKEMIYSVGIGDYIIWYIAVAIIVAIASCISWILTWILIGLLGYAWIAIFESRSVALLFGFE